MHSITRIVAVTIALLSMAPCFAKDKEPSRKVAITPDVVYGHKEGMALFYDVFTPAKANGSAVLFMVSGGWFSRWQAPETRLEMFQGLLDRGITVVAVHHGSAPRFKVPDAVADVRRAVRHVRLNAKSYKVDPQRLGVWGGSAGGHLSLMVGLASDSGNAEASDPVERVSNAVKTVVAYYPPVDLRGMSGPNDRFPALDFDAKLTADVSPLLFANQGDPPTLIVHGDADTLVPIISGRAVHEALRAAGVETQMIVIEGGDHGFRNPEHRARANAAMVEWFATHL
jgi:acetyl esterase/lipase